VGILEEPSVCLQINIQWIPFLTGVVERLADPDIWEGDDTEKNRAFDEIMYLLDAMQLEGTCNMISDIRFIDCAMEMLVAGDWIPVPGFDPECFAGTPGTPGIDGTNGTDGADGTIILPFSLSGSAEGNNLLWDLTSGLIGQGIITDFGVELGEYPPPVLPCELDNCQLANVICQWIATQYFPNILTQMGYFGEESVGDRFQKTLNVIDVHLLDYPMFSDVCQFIFDVYAGLDVPEALEASIVSGTNYIVNTLPQYMVCFLSDCGYMSIGDFASFIETMPITDSVSEFITIPLFTAFGEMAFAAIASMAKASRLQDSFMVECEPCIDELCTTYPFLTGAYNTDWNFTDGTWIEDFGYSAPFGDDAIRLNMSLSPDLEMTYIRIAGTNPSEVAPVDLIVNVTSGEIINTTFSPTTSPWFFSIAFDPDEVTGIIDIEILTDGENTAFLTDIEIHYRAAGSAPFGGETCTI
jgi:hypothetical protein